MVYKIHVRGISKSFDEKVVLEDINVKITENEIFTIVGPSGSGKSMFLRTLNRLLEPDSGDIFLDGVSIFTMDPRELRRKVGMVFQIPIIFPGTVEDNILSGPRIWGKEVSGVEKMNMVRQSLDSVDLPREYAIRDSSKVSVGEQQRVCIARAIANDPDVILMDEPTASLDPKTTLKIESLIRKLNQELGITFVIITHNIQQARKIGDTTMLMKAGKVLHVDRTEIIFSKGNHHIEELAGELQPPRNGMEQEAS